MWRAAFVLKSIFVLVGVLTPFNIADSSSSEGNADQVEPSRCEGLTTLSVASDNIIRTKAVWDSFIDANPLVIIAAADSDCEQCCDSEPVLRDL